MNDDMTLMIMVIFMTLLCFGGFQVLVIKYSNDLNDAIVKDPNKFNKMIESRIVRFLFDRFTREYMKLNCLIAHKSKNEVEKHIYEMDQIKMNLNQRNSLYRTALQYYIRINDEKAALKLQKRFNKFVDENKLNSEMKKEFDLEIKMYFHKSISTLKYIHEKLEICKEEEKTSWYIKKAYILKENKRIDEAKEIMELAISHSKNKKQKEELQELLNNDLKDL